MLFACFIFIGFTNFNASDKIKSWCPRNSVGFTALGTRLVVPKRKNMKEQTDEVDKITAKFFWKTRKVIETIGSHLTERFNLNKIRVRDLWHFQSRLIVNRKEFPDSLLRGFLISPVGA